jgi:3-methyladenine DNA glycosylase AlkC
MAEPFKNFFSEKLISNMGQHLKRSWPSLDKDGFDQDGFINDACLNLDKMELKQRSVHITSCLKAHLPDDFESAVEIMLGAIAPEKPLGGDIGIWETSDEGIAGWGIMPMSQYVGFHGLDHFDVSMNALRQMTMRSSAEFDIRFFLDNEPERVLAILKKWATDPNQHVRRLVCEGSRPRLPWGMRLHGFVADPTPVVKLLEMLKDDDEEYVRRSVANNLNDIAKDHPDLVAEIASRWLNGAGKNRTRLVKHACRTLIKQGHKATLNALGYFAPEVNLDKLTILNPKVKFGDGLSFEMQLSSRSKKDQPLIIDYAIHHLKANGKLTPKVFKWKTVNLKPNANITATKKHPMRPITTRVYYEGEHKLELIVNGVSLGLWEFGLAL